MKYVPVMFEMKDSHEASSLVNWSIFCELSEFAESRHEMATVRNIPDEVEYFEQIFRLLDCGNIVRFCII